MQIHFSRQHIFQTAGFFPCAALFQHSGDAVFFTRRAAVGGKRRGNSRQHFRPDGCVGALSHPVTSRQNFQTTLINKGYCRAFSAAGLPS